MNIQCTVSGGVTGFRQGLLRGSDGSIATFSTYAEAKAEADRLTALMNNDRAKASFSYIPVGEE